MIHQPDLSLLVSGFGIFGDNTTSTEQNPSHTYSNSSLTFPVTLTVTGYGGQTMKMLNSLSISGGSVIIDPISVPGARLQISMVYQHPVAPLSMLSSLIRPPIKYRQYGTWSSGDGNY